MPNYNFTALSSYDFEVLVRDLLQKELGLTLESFTTGKDKGIDLRYCSVRSGTIIVQCKHYFTSGFKALHSHLKNEELKKVQKLNPKRYIVATSVGLTPGNKDQIKSLFASCHLSTSDIYGKDDLNNLLGKYPEVERRNFKLWLTSEPVLERILHNAIFTRTGIEAEHIKNKIKIYVQNESYFKAKKILDELHYCIISGIPGIGKTTLAEILLIDFLEHGFEIIHISSDIEEAYAAYDSNKKQIFYYDDFLGQTALEDKFNKNEEHRLLQFISTIRKTRNARFILTTREYILNQAKLTYEKLSNSDFDYRKCVIELASYTKFNKAKILFNHVYFSDLSEEQKKEILQDKNYLKIIKHPNYNPRIIEWMTEYSQTIEYKDQSYIQIFLSNLDNPSKLWRHAFLNQLSISSQCLLIVLASLPNEVFIDDLQQAFESFYFSYAKKYSIATTPHNFKNSLDELESNFIRIEKSRDSLIIKFHNPSIRDFLNLYLYENNPIAKIVLESVIFFEQCEKLWAKNNSVHQLDNNASISIKDRIPERFPNIFWQAMEKSFEAKNVYLVNYRSDNSNSTYKVQSSRSLAKRLTFAVNVAKTLFVTEIKRIIQQMINKTIQSINQGSGEKWDLLELLNCVDELERNYQISGEQLIICSKNFFCRDFIFLDDYDYVIRFHEKFPKYISEDEYYHLVEFFENNYIEEVNSIIENIETPEEIYDEIVKLQNIGLSFKVDVSEGVFLLEEYVSELDDKLSLIEDQNDLWEEQMIEHFEGEKEDEAITYLFETLIK
ncbi:MAG: restriction endonuclease [Candidatus Delongbacteria bacterium]|nr:restriction endonuclease [Candidatus Delongbacteria bacterium]